MSSKTRLFLMTLLAVSASLIVACGGDDNKEEPKGNTTDTADNTGNTGKDTANAAGDTTNGDDTTVADDTNSEAGFVIPDSPITLSGGAYKSGDFLGYAWTSGQGTAADGTTTTVTPENFSEAIEGQALCMEGTVISDVDDNGDITYNGGAILGVNLNQPASDEPGDPPALAITPMGEGLHVQALIEGPSMVQLQIQGTDGATNPDSRFCKRVAATALADGVDIPWGDFRTNCWPGGVGPNFAGTDISVFLIQVFDNGNVNTDQDFKMCLIDLKAYGAGTGATDTAATDTATTL